MYALSIGNRVAGVGWLSATATESLIAFAQRAFAIGFYKTLFFFMIEGKQAICGCEGTYTYTHPFPQMPLQMFTCVISLSMQTRFLEHLL